MHSENVEDCRHITYMYLSNSMSCTLTIYVGLHKACGEIDMSCNHGILVNIDKCNLTSLTIQHSTCLEKPYCMAAF